MKKKRKSKTLYECLSCGARLPEPFSIGTPGSCEHCDKCIGEMEEIKKEIREQGRRGHNGARAGRSRKGFVPVVHSPYIKAVHRVSHDHRGRRIKLGS